MSAFRSSRMFFSPDVELTFSMQGAHPLSFRLLRFARRVSALMASLLVNVVKIGLTQWRCRFAKQPFIAVGLIEHMGDIVAAEPILRHLRTRFPQGCLIWVVRPEFAELIQQHPSLDAVWTVSCLSEWMAVRRLLGKSKCVDLHFHGRRCGSFGLRLDNPNTINLAGENYYAAGRTLLDAYCISSGMPPLKEAPQLFMPEDATAKHLAKQITTPIAVLHCTSNETDRNWPAESFRTLTSFLLERGWSVIEIGRKGVIEVPSARFHDACGQFSLAGYATLIRDARLFIGVDSGFAHFANALRIPSLILIGQYRGFSRYNPYSSDVRSSPMTLIHVDGPLNELRPDEVIRHVAECIGVISP